VKVKQSTICNHCKLLISSNHCIFIHTIISFTQSMIMILLL